MLISSGTHNIAVAHDSYGEYKVTREDLEALADSFDLTAIDALAAR